MRKSLATLKFKKRREKATTIQSVVRGYRDRAELSHKHSAATPLAALARGHLTRKRSRQKILVSHYHIYISKSSAVLAESCASQWASS